MHAKKLQQHGTTSYPIAKTSKTFPSFLWKEWSDDSDEKYAQILQNNTMLMYHDSQFHGHKVIQQSMKATEVRSFDFAK